jgi:peptidoglycan/LPS O-acetylase OafA/YrhL
MPALDMLRFLAVFLVLGRHLPSVGVSVAEPVIQAATLWNQIGWMGVDLFFVLSGFLVSGLLFRELLGKGCIDIKRFLIRRGLKIYPPFYTFLLLTPFLGNIIGEKISLREFLCEAFFIQNYAGGYWNHTWTLAVEEHFYISLPFIVIWLNKKFAQNAWAKIKKSFFILSAYLIFLRFATAVLTGYPVINHLTHLRLDSLFFGVLISYYFHYHYEAFQQFRKKNYKLIIVMAFLLSLIFFLFSLEGPLMLSFGLSASYFLMGLLLILALDQPFLGREVCHGRLRRCLCYLGRHSYSVYLWHMPVLLVLREKIDYSAQSTCAYLVLCLSYVVLSFIVGLLLSNLVEVPTMRIRDRFFPSKSSAN